MRPPILDVVSIPEWFTWPVLHIRAVIGVGQQCITGNQWYVDTEHRSMLNWNPPTLTDPMQSRTESQGKLWSSRDIMRSCCSFISPPVFSLIFVPHVLQSGVKSVFEGPPWLSVLLRLTHDPPCVHTDTHTHSISRLIAVIKQRAVARSYESAVLFSTSPTRAGWNTPIFCTTRSQSEWGHR